MIKIFNATTAYNAHSGIYDINLTIDKGEFVYLIGPSGAGKSTLLKLIYLDLLPQKGHIVVADFNSTKIKKREIPLLRRQLGIVFQDFKLFTDRSVYENIAFVLQVTGVRRREIQKRVLNVLSEVGLSHRRHAYVTELSGGEKQKIAIARALVNEPFVLLADEPTGNLDPAASDEIMALLQRINNRGTAVLMATHNYSLLKKYPGRIVRLEEGKLSA
jgi:cell division transport system ATP-binding protein